MIDMQVYIDSVFYVAKEVALEVFGDEYIVFLADKLNVYEINCFAKTVLDKLDGEQTLRAIVEDLLLTYEVKKSLLEKDILEAIEEFENMGIIKMKYIMAYSKENDRAGVQYLANPDVVVKEIDEDGALLFNLEEENLKAINPTGLEIWNMLQNPKTKQSLVDHLCTLYDGASAEEIGADVEEFVDSMIRDHFIGIVLE